MRFNTAISSMMIFSNALQKAPQVSRAAVLTFLQLLAPFAPHLAEELWARLGGSDSIQRAPWPVYDPTRLVTTDVKLVFQVNGKHRGDQLVPVGLAQDTAVDFLCHATLVEVLEFLLVINVEKLLHASAWTGDVDL